MSRQDYQSQHPDFPWLDAANPAGVEEYLRRQGMLEADETLADVTRAGEGNMNLTLRVRTKDRSFILKQSRPWVEKYDHIAAPWDRALVEIDFYRRIADLPEIAHAMPQLLGTDPAGCVLLFEDLGPAGDCTNCYHGQPFAPDEIASLAHYLAALHQVTGDPHWANREMRALNHQHIYVLPLEPNESFNLDAYEHGLTAAARALQDDDSYCTAVATTGQRYLADGPRLVHGDFFPGSWLRTERGLRIIDTEFSFFGDEEFDLGVAIAHFALAAQPIATAEEFLNGYERLRSFDVPWVARYAACEVMRRLIGVAQLPIPNSTHFRAPLLLRSRAALSQSDWRLLWDS